jgi:hypothetical protein
VTDEWLSPWEPIGGPRDAEVLSRELARECPKGHVLYGRAATFLARRQDCDDFLVRLEGGRMAVVHLTWSRETDPYWPGTTLYESMAEWRDRVMIPDHADWTE